MYIGNFDVDMLTDDYFYKVTFIYPEGAVPKSVPLTNAVRKENMLAFFFRTSPTKEELDKIVKLANSDFVNPCRHITDKFGGVKYDCYEKDRDSLSWRMVQKGLD